MIFYLLSPLIAITVGILQSAVPDVLFFDKFSMDMGMLLVVYAAFYIDTMKGAFLSFFLGLTMDCLTGSILGLYVLLYALIFLFAGYFSTKVYVKKGLILIFFTTACACFEGLLMTYFHYLLFGIDMIETGLKIFIPQALVIGILSPFLFEIFSRIEAWFNGASKPA